MQTAKASQGFKQSAFVWDSSFEESHSEADPSFSNPVDATSEDIISAFLSFGSRGASDKLSYSSKPFLSFLSNVKLSQFNDRTSHIILDDRNNAEEPIGPKPLTSALTARQFYDALRQPVRCLYRTLEHRLLKLLTEASCKPIPRNHALRDD